VCEDTALPARIRGAPEERAMSALPGLIGLIIFIYIRPHEFFQELQDYNFLYVFLGACVVGILHDISERRTVIMVTPLTGWVLLFLAWCFVTLLLRKSSDFGPPGTSLVVIFLLFALIAHGVQQLQGFFKLTMTIFFCGLFVAYVGADQGAGPFQCVMEIPRDKNQRGWPDGRYCTMKEEDGSERDGTWLDCVEAGGRPGIKYACEKVGLFATNSVGGGRVRYIGVLRDPNDLALATSISTPFAFAYFEIRPSVMRLALLIFGLACVALAVAFSGSRGGAVTFGAVLGAYFVKKYGWKRGALVAAAMAVPMIIMGGRSDTASSASTMERLGCSAAGLKLLLNQPLTGVGYSLFIEHHDLTAHNSYVLTAGELGLPGTFMFVFLLYLSFKIAMTVLRHEMPDSYDTRVIKAVAMAMLAAFAGLAVGVFFLSWAYHYVLWLHFGLAAALYAVVKRRYRDYRCDFTFKEMRNVTVGYIAFLTLWGSYIKYKGAWE
jgi:hypothetical protein